MARFLVERSFPDGLEIPLTEQGAQACMSVVGTNAELGVTWVHSYVTEDHRKTFCIYDAPTPDAIRKADVVLVSARRRLPPKADLDALREHIAAGKPVVGIRTACHAWCLRTEKENLAAAAAGRGLLLGRVPAQPAR